MLGAVEVSEDIYRSRRRSVIEGGPGEVRGPGLLAASTDFRGDPIPPAQTHVAGTPGQMGIGSGRVGLVQWYLVCYSSR